MPEATAAQDGYMQPKEAFAKLDGIDPGAGVNVDPSKFMQLLVTWFTDVVSWW